MTDTLALKNATALHRQAMDLADEASIERLKGNDGVAQELTTQAFTRERDAASMVAGDLSLEPTRSVLHRSAASLALECNEIREAERLIAVGLAGNPPDQIADELRDLLEQVHFQRHLSLRGLILAPEEFQVSITGDAVGLGIAPSDAFVTRVQDIEKLIYRTAERKTDRGFRDRGKRVKTLEKAVEVFLSTPRVASFAVSLRLGQSSQMSLPGIGLSQAVIDELLDCFDLFNAVDLDALKERIPDQSYYRNFVGLAKRIAPDGVQIDMVAFTTKLNGRERSVVLSRSQAEIPIGSAEEPIKPSVERIRGTLKFADSTRENKDEIKIVDDAGTKHRILVPTGMMDDIVRPLWDYKVEVLGIRQNRLIRLEDIRKIEE
jgi:hypothetical protein